ncbi:TSUP family transporter [Bacteriovorax sp. Seq25_V]|uniref:sulfite exporter TauE/SafE family protein n=1 Tax=Bacteriovorax sp. Seq25_V TaxID=1201288 RepID=UPI00038A1197|nr:TSUP family transporter [Bacteriovorax sp. Seq25_V]EQC44865.1 sulfite exporter TauE/SafE [Bacteriovorax sp. Seq25_V]
MELSLIQYVILFVLVGFAGFVDSIAGGGGLITIPTYISLGVPSELILGTNKCVSTTGGTMAIFRYLKSKSINLHVMVYGVIAGIIGSYTGAYFSKFLDNQKMVYLLIILVPVILYLNYKRSKIKPDQVNDLTKKQMIARIALIGLVIGCYDGFFGPGTGTFLIISISIFLHMEMVKASPNARIINFSSNISAFIYFIFKGAIAWKIASVAIFGSLLGNYLGSGHVIKGNTKVVSIIFNLVLIALLLKSFFDLYHS